MTTQTPDSKPRALIAMSGGVDSSVAAWLMQRDGYDCTGITMRLTRNETLGQSGFHTCCSEKDIEDAAEVAYAMDIPYEVLDFTADFRESSRRAARCRYYMCFSRASPLSRSEPFCPECSERGRNRRRALPCANM